MGTIDMLATYNIYLYTTCHVNLPWANICIYMCVLHVFELQHGPEVQIHIWGIYHG
jgi:hypothetical protein